MLRSVDRDVANKTCRTDIQGIIAVNICYRSVQKLLSSSLLTKNVNSTVYRTIMLSVVWYGCETWSLTLREEHRLRVFENRVLRRIFGPKRDEETI